MKTTIKTIILAAASLFAAMSCQKEVAGKQELVKEGETIQVSIDANLSDLVAADDTKATAKPVIRLEWADGDKVQAYCGETKISTGDGLTVTPSDNKISAKLSGTITAPVVGQTITFVYSNGCTVENNLTFNFSNQSTSIPFVAYATLPYDGTATLTEKMVEFKFATSVMKIAATNLAGGDITDATISGINTKVTLNPSASGAPAINEGTPGNIKTTNIDASSDGTRAIVTFGLVQDSNTGRAITVKQGDFTNKGAITSATIESSKSYTTPASLFTCGTLGTGENAHDYVLIAGTKWATRNIGATADTGTDSYGTYFAWGDVTGQEASTKTGSSPIANAFTNGFSSSTYSYSDNPLQLPLEKDAAHSKWGGTWRMPTSAEFKALKDATYWKLEDGGCYVYAPQSGDAGKKNSDSGVTGTYNKSDALLFFPAPGHGTSTNLYGAGTHGRYWSSSLYTGNTDYAYYLIFYSDTVDPQTNGNRYLGFSVRPVSD